MSDIDDLDHDLYIDDDELEILDSNKPDKDKNDLDNDDNENDYINDDEEENDNDLQDDDYDNYELNDEDIEVDDDLDNYNPSNTKINFIDNDLDNESKIQYIVKGDDKITSNILTIYEITELIGIRATQISQGSPVFINIENLSDPIEMAKKEIINNKCPLYIKRYIGLDKYELWDPNTMVKPKL
jgi:DNA-directed RNA polymerase subunit K/omega